MRYLIFLLFLAACTQAGAASSLQTEHATLTLLSEQRTVAQGDSLWLGVRLYCARIGTCIGATPAIPAPPR